MDKNKTDFFLVDNKFVICPLTIIDGTLAPILTYQPNKIRYRIQEAAKTFPGIKTEDIYSANNNVINLIFKQRYEPRESQYYNLISHWFDQQSIRDISAFNGIVKFPTRNRDEHIVLLEEVKEVKKVSFNSNQTENFDTLELKIFGTNFNDWFIINTIDPNEKTLTIMIQSTSNVLAENEKRFHLRNLLLIHHIWPELDFIIEIRQGKCHLISEEVSKIVKELVKDFKGSNNEYFPIILHIRKNRHEQKLTASITHEFCNIDVT